MEETLKVEDVKDIVKRSRSLKGEGHFCSRNPAESCIVIMQYVWHCFSIFSRFT